MPSYHPLESKLAAAWPPDFWQEVTVLVALSGGADSVALVRAMTGLEAGERGRLCVAHFNHQLRGDESRDDEAFAVDLCGRLGVVCEVGYPASEMKPAEASDGLEAAARAARYEFLQATAQKLGARYVVTAHTADDQAETILHRIIRGTGIAGLAGMGRVRRLGPATTLIRPLLGIRRSELRAYLQELGQSYRHDSSNDERRFTRNRIRHELLPELAVSFNAGVVDALLRLGGLAAEVQTVVDKLVEDVAEGCVRTGGSQIVCIDTTFSAGHPPYVIRELLMAVWRKQDWPLQAMGFAQWEQLAQMAASSQRPRKQMFPGGVLAEAQQGQLVLKRDEPERRAHKVP